VFRVPRGQAGRGILSAEVSFILVPAGVIWLYWGSVRLRRLLFPLILLAPSIPLTALFYNTATAPLQLFASEFAARIAQMCNVSIYRDGNILERAHISLGVG
jgi:hypothetical protein